LAKSRVAFFRENIKVGSETETFEFSILPLWFDGIFYSYSTITGHTKRANGQCKENKKCLRFSM